MGIPKNEHSKWFYWGNWKSVSTTKNTPLFSTIKNKTKECQLEIKWIKFYITLSYHETIFDFSYIVFVHGDLLLQATGQGQQCPMVSSNCISPNGSAYLFEYFELKISIRS